MGPAWAKELMLSGEPVDAETALRIGLANRVFEPDELVEDRGEGIGAFLEKRDAKLRGR